MTPYRSVERLAKTIVVLVAVVLAVDVLATLFAAACVFSPPQHLDLTAFDAIVSVQKALVIAAFALTPVFAYGATRNLDALGTQIRRFTPGMAAWFFFIPVANLIMPHQVMTALWNESQPPATPSERLGNSDVSVRAVNAWWGFLALGIIFAILSSHPTGTPFELLLRGVFVLAIQLGAGASFITVVRGIARRQREQWLDLERRRSVPQPTADALR